MFLNYGLIVNELSVEMTLNNTKRPPDSNTKDGLTNDVWRQDTPSMHFHLGLVNKEIFLRATMVKKNQNGSPL